VLINLIIIDPQGLGYALIVKHLTSMCKTSGLIPRILYPHTINPFHINNAFWSEIQLFSKRKCFYDRSDIVLCSSNLKVWLNKVQLNSHESVSGSILNPLNQKKVGSEKVLFVFMRVRVKKTSETLYYHENNFDLISRKRLWEPRISGRYL
jgi:hypothetical protein